MYSKHTVTVVKCDYCGASANEHPEADGSPGLPPKGWRTYDPEYMRTLTSLLPSYRVDFCSVECKDKWLYGQIDMLTRLMADRSVVYRFSH